jgi:MRG-binding protein
MAVASTSSHVPDAVPNDDDEFLDTVEGEIAFFRSLMRARPVGTHRHFRIMAMRNAILSDTGKKISIEAMWQKLRGYYNLDALEAAVSSYRNARRVSERM